MYYKSLDRYTLITAYLQVVQYYEITAGENISPANSG